MDFIQVPGQGNTVEVPTSSAEVMSINAPSAGTVAIGGGIDTADTVPMMSVNAVPSDTIPLGGATMAMDTIPTGGATMAMDTIPTGDTTMAMDTIPMGGIGMDTIPTGDTTVAMDTIPMGGIGMDTIPMDGGIVADGAGAAAGASASAPAAAPAPAATKTKTKRQRITYSNDESKTGPVLRRFVKATHENDVDDGKTEYDHDLIVIGGGSGGLAAAKRAVEAGHSTLLLDYVKPSPAGTRWGLGGTCVNVGCIPKKLFHTAALMGEARKMAVDYGWKPADAEHSWDALRNKVHAYIVGLNSSYQEEMMAAGVEYKMRLGSFVDPHTVRLTDRRGRTEDRTARRVLIATGGRPRPLSCPGGDLAISSDDIFTLDHDPGKTLVVGASYVALECAGFLTGTGHDTTVMVRSIFLRGFDQSIANMIASNMQDHGTKFIKPATPTSIERQDDGRLKVTFTYKNGTTSSDIYDTVLSAVGRIADTSGLNLETAGVEVAKNGKLPTVNEQTNVPHIYAVGDILHGKLELTPVAIQAAKLLIDRLYRGSTVGMDYELVPTTVFTPLEYGACGLPEEVAIERFGADAVEIYHAFFTPLEWSLTAGKDKERGYVKLVCNLNEGERVVGLHYLGPNAGEVTQGFATALRLGATYQDIYATVGIHPTTAEKLTTATATRRNGEDPSGGGC